MTMALRWGIAGAGRIAHDFVEACRLRPAEHQVVAVGSGRLANAERFAAEHAIDRAYEGYAAVADDPRVDVVYVANLNTQHYAAVKTALERGKPVLCEKPLTTDARRAAELVALAKQKKVFLMEAVWSRCFPAYEAVIEAIRSGCVGDVVAVNVSFGFDLRSKERVASKALGGGVTLDIGVYALQFQQLVFGAIKPIEIVATGSLNADGVDETVGAVLAYQGAIASLVFTGAAELPNEAIVVGTKGTISVPSFWCPTRVVVNGKAVEFPLPEGGEFLHRNGAGMVYEADEVKRCLRDGLLESPKISLDETIKLAESMDLIMRQVGVVSAESG